MDFNTTMDSFFSGDNTDENGSLLFDFSNSSDLAVNFNNLSLASNLSKIRYNCTGSDEVSMKTYREVSWWFAGIVQVSGHPVMTSRVKKLKPSVCENFKCITAALG